MSAVHLYGYRGNFSIITAILEVYAWEKVSILSQRHMIAYWFWIRPFSVDYTQSLKQEIENLLQGNAFSWVENTIFPRPSKLLKI